MKNLRRTLVALSVMLVCLLAVPTQKVDAAAKLSKTKATVYVGKTTKLTVNGTKKKVTWTSNNKKVATVANGKVTAKKQGTAVITAKVSGKKYRCTVTVKNQSINKSKVTLEKGKTTSIKVNGAYKTVTYKSSNTKVATVAKNGTVKAVGVGTATITARHNGKNYTSKVTVKENNTVVVKMDKEIVNDKEMASVTKGYLKQLDIKSQKSDSKFVYYTVTKTSYNNLLANIKKSLNSDIAKIVKSQDLFKKITYSSDCTKINLYMNSLFEDSDDMDEDLSDDGMDQIESLLMGIIYYQAFTGKTAETFSLTLNYYDYATNMFVFSLPIM